MISSPSTRPSDDMFHFHPRTTNPELWRTTIPLVVRERCKGHKGLILTWVAIYWLIVLHAASGRTHFGMREIAEEARVGRNELAGPKGYIQRLVNYGLLRIIGYKHINGLRKPRPVYHIDLEELERLSLELVPDVLRDHHIDRPPPAYPDPRQMQLFVLPPDQPDGAEASLCLSIPQLPLHQTGTAHAGLDRGVTGITQATHSDGTEREPSTPPLPARQQATGTATRETRTDTRPTERAAYGTGQGTHETGTDTRPTERAAYGTGQGTRETGTDTRPTERAAYGTGQGTHETGTDTHQTERAAHGTGQGTHETGTDLSRNRDVDRRIERTNEGVSQTLTPDLIQSLITQVTEAVVVVMSKQGRLNIAETPPSLTELPAPPPGFGPLPAPVLTLWQGDDPTLSRRETHQLAMTASEYDSPTGGYGAYWLGRAILMTDLCLSERGQPHSLTYLRRVLRRWREEDSWGSDRDGSETVLRPAVAAPARPQPASPPPEAASSHPAVRAYMEALHEMPNAVQTAQIAETVRDLDTWRQVLTDWQLNGWGERSVGKMLDRYQKLLSVAAANEPPPSAFIIHTYPGLSDEQRDRWIWRFHAATSAAEKRAIIARLEQEHPR